MKGVKFFIVKKAVIISVKNTKDSRQPFHALSRQQLYIGIVNRTCRIHGEFKRINENISNKDRLLEHEQQRLQQLQNQLDILKAAGGEPNNSVTTVDYDKYQQLMNNNDQLMNKNR